MFFLSLKPCKACKLVPVRPDELIIEISMLLKCLQTEQL